MKSRTINLLLICVSLVVGRAFAADVRLAWDASATAGVTNYTVYSWYSETNAIVKHCGTNLATTIQVTNRAIIYATATKDGIESDPSNTLRLEVPSAPGLRVVLQYSPKTLTNFADVGFFRVQIGSQP